MSYSLLRDTFTVLFDKFQRDGSLSNAELKHLVELWVQHYQEYSKVTERENLVSNIFELSLCEGASVKGRRRDFRLFLKYLLDEGSRSSIEQLTEEDILNISEREPIFSNFFGPIHISDELTLLCFSSCTIFM